jgi:lactate dehydrogenase-like 2-hydroxyacid dehydrogenase
MAPKHKVILVDGMEGDAPMPAIEEREELAAIDAELVILGCRTEEDLIEQAKDADAILTWGAPVTRRVMECLPNCQCVVRYGVGYDTVDIEGATATNTIVINVPDFCWEEVANHAIALLLCCAKKIIRLDDLVRQGKWREAKAVQAPMGAVYGQTLGIVGCGRWPARRPCSGSRSSATTRISTPASPPRPASSSSRWTTSWRTRTTSPYTPI